MGLFSKVPLVIDKVHTVPQRALSCRPGLGRLNQVYGPNRSTPSVLNISGKYINILPRVQIEISMIY